MTAIYNVYCDESGHLEHDQLPVMVLGALWCLLEDASAVAADLRGIKIRHGLSSDFEIKWVKVSPAKQQFYLDVLDYFFSTDGLHFRALIVPDKSALRHEAFGQDHDAWYYKMCFDLLKVLFLPDAEYRIYLDIKDTLGPHKIAKLHNVLCNSIYDFQKEIIARLQTVRSHEVALLQLADLLIGIVAYANRGLQGNTAKLALVARMRECSGYALTRTTLLREEKVNLFRWHPRESPR
jgi:hypothetical protein